MKVMAKLTAPTQKKKKPEKSDFKNSLADMRMERALQEKAKLDWVDEEAVYDMIYGTKPVEQKMRSTEDKEPDSKEYDTE